MTKQLIPTKPTNKGTEMIASFRASGKTRTAFCRESGIKPCTFDYYHHLVRRQEQSRMIPVELSTSSNSPVQSEVRTLAVWLRNGRRLEMSWHGDENSLGRLVSQLEAE